MGEQIVPEEVFETSSCRAVSVSNDEEVPRESSSLFVRMIALVHQGIDNSSQLIG